MTSSNIKNATGSSMTDIFSIIERSKAPLIVNVNHFEGGI